VPRHRAWRVVPSREWRGRLDNARAFLQSARDLSALAEATSIGDPAISNAVLATIAYADAVTVRFAGIQNATEHAGLPRTLTQAIGERATPVLTRLNRILAWKDESQYGHRTHSLGEARTVLLQAERFAEWAEAELAQP
jgi:hypothetical protein